MVSPFKIPHSFADFLRLRTDDPTTNLNCKNCALPFNGSNVWTAEGWAMTQTKGICECCNEEFISWMTGDFDE